MQTLENQSSHDLASQLKKYLSDSISDENLTLIESAVNRLMKVLIEISFQGDTSPNLVGCKLDLAANMLEIIDAVQLAKRDLVSPQFRPLSNQLKAVETAYNHLIEALSQATSGEWTTTVDTLTYCPTLDQDQVIQAQKHAEEKRRLLKEYTFCTASKFSDLLATFLEESSNKPRTLARWLKENKLLGMKIKGDWHYPAIQVNNKGEFYKNLPQLIPRAVQAGYTHWEIMSWLVSPFTIEMEHEVGKPLENLETLQSPGDVMRAIKALPDPEAPIQVIPLKLLQGNENTAFKKTAGQWLGG